MLGFYYQSQERTRIRSLISLIIQNLYSIFRKMSVFVYVFVTILVSITAFLIGLTFGLRRTDRYSRLRQSDFTKTESKQTNDTKLDMNDSDSDVGQSCDSSEAIQSSLDSNNREKQSSNNSEQWKTSTTDSKTDSPIDSINEETSGKRRQYSKNVLKSLNSYESKDKPISVESVRQWVDIDLLSVP